jgi:hypothetical protein
MPVRALLLGVVMSMVPAAAEAQMQIRPERPPERVAGDTAWYKAGEPVVYRGSLFYPAGSQIFFDGSLLVLAGEYRGIPLYVDPTLEPGSLVYVPIGGGLMQPYEKPRVGDLAATSGSRMPTFPPATSTAIEVTAEAVGTAGSQPPPPPIGDTVAANAAPRSATAARRAPARSRAETIAPNRAPRNSGIWIQWNGAQWTMSSAQGAAVRVGPQFVPIGTYDGRTVYRGPGGDGTIWIETVQGLAVPWHRRN